MQSAEDFMREFFHARTVNLRKELEIRALFRREFFSKECLWESRKGEIERSETEVLVSLSNSDSELLVVSRRDHSFPILRYHLQKKEGRWSILHVEFQCFLCNDCEHKGRSDCRICKGLGWLGTESVEDGIRSLKARFQGNEPPSITDGNQ